MPEKATRDRLHEALGTSDDDLVEAGLLERMVPPQGGKAFYVPVSEEERVYRLDMSADKLGDAMNSPHMRASFLRIGELSPDRQRQLAELIDTFYEADEAYRAQIKRDAQRRREEGIED